ncbi:extracellular solute-binding protein [Bradyrhizobium sp. CCBAU 45394]|uniref:extracellular solute-binding protein n=1 Tax=Bradyrhizobium sp. CCBAU 45394 TaxID=1325087 RepID=UPI0023037A9F|nr:extracellular solute-binding protein [Bradyrhizobium sp. CCBAU 45394]
MERRAFLKVATVAAAGTLAAPYVRGQSKKFSGITLRVNGYGGLYDEALKKSVAAPLEEKYGLKVQFIPGTTSADFVKLIANRENPPYDLFMGDSPNMVELINAGIIEEIKVAEVPNVKRILEGFREFGEYGVPFSVASVVPVYNSKYIKQPLTSYSDIARADLAGRAVIMAPATYGSLLTLLGMAEENGGSISNVEPALKVMRAAKPNILALAQTNVAEVQMFQNEEVYAGIFWDGRAHELRTKGIPVATVVPPKGVYAVISYINVVKGIKYPEAAYAYAEQLLSDQGILGVPQALRYGVTTDVKLPEELRQDLLFNSPERIALKKRVEWEKLIANRSSWIEELNKIIRT